MEQSTKKWADFFDALNLIGHLYPNGVLPGWDFGDSCREWGSFAFFMAYRRRLGLEWTSMLNSQPAAFMNAEGHYRLGPGQYCRHPESETLWHRDPKEFSRDQSVALECALFLHGMTNNLREIYWAQFKRLGKYQNKDFRTWEWSYALRFLGWWWTYPVIAFLDLGLLLDAIIRVISFKISIEDSGKHLNHQQLLILCNDFLPTPASFLAKKIYCIFMQSQEPWDYYYRHPENPPMNELARDVLISRLT